MTLICVGGETD